MIDLTYCDTDPACADAARRIAEIFALPVPVSCLPEADRERERRRLAGEETERLERLDWRIGIARYIGRANCNGMSDSALVVAAKLAEVGVRGILWASMDEHCGVPAYRATATKLHGRKADSRCVTWRESCKAFGVKFWTCGVPLDEAADALGVSASELAEDLQQAIRDSCGCAKQ